LHLFVPLRLKIITNKMNNKNKNIDQINNVYFIGIGGIGMSALARYFNANGKMVKGYDKTPSPLTAKLQEEGIEIHFEDNVSQLDKNADLVVFTPAIPEDQKILNWYKDHDFDLQKRSQVLGMLTQDTYCIAVAGSHGKTTVSSMIAHILNETIGCTAFLGGIVTNFASNYINSNNKTVVVEADEYDRSFMTLKPNITIITSIDTDHLDIYGNYENIVKEFKDFAQLNAEDGLLIANHSLADFNLNKNTTQVSYGVEEGEIFVSNYRIENGKYFFDVNIGEEVIEDFELNLAGKHNVENAVAAIVAVKTMNVPNEEIKEALASFKGIYRRFEKRAETENAIYIDDYAHHPNEIKALLGSVKELYPDRKIVAIFQPHLFSRTKDLAEDFATHLSLADEVLLMPIYPAREKPMEGVTSDLILKDLSVQGKIVKKEDLINEVKARIEDTEQKVILTIGAGDIDRFIPLVVAEMNK
jgi:UDP-N-acetylmuramate--alanine ligase